MISIVIPTLNEEKNLPYVLKDIEKFFEKKGLEYEVIVVDGYSEDRTVEIAKKFKAKVLFDEFGKGSALIKGMKAAKGEIIISMDADCSNRVNELELLISGIKAGYDACFGSRFLQGGGTGDMPLIRKIGNKFFVFLVNILYGAKYSDLCYGYRSFKKEAIKKLKLEEKGFGIETEISIKAMKNDLKVLEVPSFEKPRKFGKGNLKTLSDGLTILKVILKNLFC
ncbi:MAG: glycosyltransferase family 2 protein [Candidatus Micrarchaeia archaeon]